MCRNFDDNPSIISCFTMENLHCGFHLNCLCEAVQMKATLYVFVEN